VGVVVVMMVMIDELDDVAIFLADNGVGGRAGA
jgi:hypothetical protein